MRQLLVSTRKGLFEIGQRQGRWTIVGSHFLGDNVTLALGANAVDPRWYAALNLGHFGVKLRRSGDAGASWQDVGLPVYPEKPAETIEAEAASTENFGRPVPWKLNLIWALERAGPDQPGALWCGTLPGGCFRSQDHGDSWSLVEPLWFMPQRREWFGGGADWPGIHSVCVDPRSTRRVALGISCGGVWLTEDNGATWCCRAQGMRAAYMPPEQAGNENIQDPHRLVQCPGDPRRWWAQHHNGIFRSDDDLATWTEITEAGPSTFGFAVVVHPRDPDIAWFVPAEKDERRIPVGGRLVVTRTTNGGRSFEVLSKGLPEASAYDIVFRHAMDIDASGGVLAFGSTSGGLWISEDAGDGWQMLPERLPPVHAVRWVER